MEYGPSEFDITHRFVLSGVWQLPLGMGHAIGNNWSRGLNGVLGGWEFSPILTVQGGLPLTISARSIDGSKPAHSFLSRRQRRTRSSAIPVSAFFAGLI